MMMEELNVIGMPEEANDYEFVLCYHDCEGQLHYVMHTESGFQADLEAKSFTNPLILHNVRIQGKRRKEPKKKMFTITGRFSARVVATDEDEAEELFTEEIRKQTGDFESFDEFFVDEVWED